MYNEGMMNKKTIVSVINQTYDDYEYIIIDGNSTDDSVKVIKQFADKVTYWISEPDSGIYNAMNKGIAASTGDYLIFLNSSDVFYNERVLELVNKNHHNSDLIIGRESSGSASHCCVRFLFRDRVFAYGGAGWKLQ